MHSTSTEAVYNTTFKRIKNNNNDKKENIGEGRWVGDVTG